jgi:Outer membrane protein beta-barrel domain
MPTNTTDEFTAAKNRKSFFTIRLFTLGPCLAVLLLLFATEKKVQAQDENPKFTVGVHYTTLNVTEKSDKDSGLGIRFSYNLNDYLAVEAEGNGLPQSREGGGNNETQGFFGARTGVRTERYGIYAKVRPGFTRFYLLGINPGVNAFEQGHTRLSVDVGGVFEYYPSRHTAVRLDVGDTMVHFKSGDFFYRRLDQPMPVTKRLSHNLQVTAGVAFRF